MIPAVTLNDYWLFQSCHFGDYLPLITKGGKGSINKFGDHWEMVNHRAFNH